MSIISKGKPLPVPMVLDDREEWMEEAFKGMDALVARGRDFSADDFRDLVPVPRVGNWVGSVFTTYQTAGYIKPIGFELSRAKSRRGGVIRRWEVIREKRS